jgi:hypothetical protein
LTPTPSRPRQVEIKEGEEDANADAMYGATGLPAPPGVAADAGWDESAPFDGGAAGGDEWGAAAPAAPAGGAEWEAAPAPAAGAALEYAAPSTFGAQY